MAFPAKLYEMPTRCPRLIVRCQSAAQNPRAFKLRKLLEAPGVLQGPCCHDALSAKLIEDAGTGSDDVFLKLRVGEWKVVGGGRDVLSATLMGDGCTSSAASFFKIYAPRSATSFFYDLWLMKFI